MNINQKVINIIIIVTRWLLAALLLSATVTMFTTSHDGAAIPTVSTILTVCTVFSSLWFTISHRKYVYDLGSLLLSIAETIVTFVIMLVSLQYNKDGFSAPFGIMIACVIVATAKLIFETTLFIGYRKKIFTNERKVPQIKIKPLKDWFYVNNPKTLFFPFANFVSVMSIFGMFGNLAIVQQFGETIEYPVNMFECAFGCGRYNTMYGIGASSGLIAVFVLLLISFVLYVFDLIRNKKIGADFYIFNSVRLALALTISILSFCSVNFISNIDWELQQTAIIGVGPLTVGIMNAIACVGYVLGDAFGLLSVNKDQPKEKPVEATLPSNENEHIIIPTGENPVVTPNEGDRLVATIGKTYPVTPVEEEHSTSVKKNTRRRKRNVHKK